MQIKVNKRNVYGVERVYPVCANASMLAKLAGTKTLSKHQLKIIRALGYKVIEVEQTRKEHLNELLGRD